MTPLGVLAGLLLVAFVPGFLLLEAAFPRGPPTGGRPGSEASLTLLLSVVLSLALTTLAGLALGSLPAGAGKGAFSGRATGAPNLETVLGTLSIVLFALAYVRGAFPRLAALVGWVPDPPTLGPHDPPSRRPTLADLVDLRGRETDLTFRILAIRLRTLLPQPDSARRHRRRTLERLRETRDDLRGQAEELERELAQARFGGSA